MLIPSARLLLVCRALSVVSAAAVAAGADTEFRAARLTLRATEAAAPLREAMYVAPSGAAMIRPGGWTSADNGRTWTQRGTSPDFDGALPFGYRRNLYPLFVDAVNGRVLQIVLSLDTPGLDPTIDEPPVGQEEYYLRYRVSDDGGATFLLDEPIAAESPTGAKAEMQGIYLGDIGSQPIRTRQGRIVVPAQVSPRNADGSLANPGGGWTYTDVVMLLGSWQDNGRLRWTLSERIEGDPARSTRGMIEPTVAEMANGRLLCVMRGSNGCAHDPEFKIASHKWRATSDDGGETWTTPEPWTYDDGEAFYSPSSMSQLLRHSSGRTFWIGNISPTNCRENDPRYPLMIGEVDPQTLRLVRSSVLVVDTKRANEASLNLSHWWGVEDRETREIVLAGARYAGDYKSSTPVTYRVGVDEER
jgi:hypothetical protein